MVDRMEEDEGELTVEKADRDYDAQYKTGNVMMIPMHFQITSLENICPFPCFISLYCRYIENARSTLMMKKMICLAH